MTITLCTDKAQWDRFVSASPQGSIFCCVGFLDSLGVDYDLWWVKEHGHPQLGAVVLKDETGQPIRAPFAFSPYQGVLFDEKHVRLPTHSRVKKALELVVFLLEELERRYDRISFCLHPLFEDIRGFSWFHDRKPGLGRFQVTVNYTAWIDLRSSHDFEAYLATIRAIRRYEYRKALREGFTIEVSHDLVTLEALYRLTFERQGIQVEPAIEQCLQAIATAALSRGFGELLLCRAADGAAVSATLFLYDDHHGYYLVGANHPAFRQTGSGTFLLLESIRRYQARGFNWVDVCGMNRPGHGDFKASFNAAPIPYFVVTWERPS